jgi:hypothetical protein
MSFPIENLTFTIYGVFYKVVPQWAGETKNWER